MTTTMASSTLMNNESWHSLRVETHREIMNTDILCEILFPEAKRALATEKTARVFDLLRTFEARYSRFKKDNDLWQFNHSQSRELNLEFFNLLQAAVYFYHQTDGLFDPSILPALEQEGYASAPYQGTTLTKSMFSELQLDTATRRAQKPATLFIDLGGIGKGFVVDQAVLYLNKHFENFLIDGGGDVYARGVNKKEGYPYWAIEVEHPISGNPPVALLILSDMAVATSGRNRRHWKKNGSEKHHLIDPATQRSARTDFLSVSVIAGSTVSADVLAKTLFIAGEDRGPKLAEHFHIPALFVDHAGQVTLNHFVQPYVWKH